MLSKRGQELAESKFLLYDGWLRCQANVFDLEKSPQGCINLGTSELGCVADIWEERLKGFRAAQAVSEADTHYCDMMGTESFRTAIATFLSREMRVSSPLLPSHISVTNGCGSAMEQFAMSTCDAGDGILLPAPFYGGFDMDLGRRAHVQRVPVALEHNSPFLTRDACEAAYANATAQGITIRAFLLCNPHNPFGIVFESETVQMCIDFAASKAIHIVIDEIYFLSTHSMPTDESDASVHDSSASKGFPNALSLSSVPDPDRLHVVWGFSKDFGLSGFRVGVFITKNAVLRHCMEQTAYFYCVSTLTQSFLRDALLDTSFTRHFFAQSRTRLHAACSLVCARLSALHIPYVPAHAGFFVWVDLRRYCGASFAAEDALWRRFLDAEVYVAPGAAFSCAVPGFFRIVFSRAVPVIELAMERIERVLSQTPQTAATADTLDVVSASSSGNVQEEEESLESLAALLLRQLKDQN